MKKANKIGFLVCFMLLLACLPMDMMARTTRHKPIDILADSLIKLTVARAADSVGLAREYNAQLYIKGQVHVRKKNIFYHSLEVDY